MTEREFVRLTAEKLLEQGGYAYAKTPRLNNKATCLYRAPNGRKCGIGQHIPDELYSRGFEGDSIGTLLDRDEKLRAYFETLVDSNRGFAFLNWVQANLHDHRAFDNLPLLTADEAEVKFNDSINDI